MDNFDKWLESHTPCIPDAPQEATKEGNRYYWENLVVDANAKIASGEHTNFIVPAELKPYVADNSRLRGKTVVHAILFQEYYTDLLAAAERLDNQTKP